MVLYNITPSSYCSTVPFILILTNYYTIHIIALVFILSFYYIYLNLALHSFIHFFYYWVFYYSYTSLFKYNFTPII